MSIFRQRRRVTDPSGHEWELYAYRLRVRRRGATFDPALDDVVAVTPATEAGLAAFDAILWGLGLIPRLLVRLLWDLPLAALRVPSSDSWTIEAVSWYPRRTSRIWITSTEWRDETIAQVGDAIQRGIPPRPAHAAPERCGTRS